MARRITRTLFDLLAIGTRMSVTRLFTEEISWWSSLDGDALGVVCRDLTDDDYGYVVLLRDGVGRFRGADIRTSLPSERQATAQLRIAMAEAVRDPAFVGSMPQGDEPRRPLDLFEDRGVPDDRLHPYYRILRDAQTRSPARRVFQAISPWLVSSDPHLVKEFQETQFDQRLWEIYLWAMFRDQGYDVEHRVAPDLRVTSPFHGFSVEATTIAPSLSGPLAVHPKPRTPAEHEAFLADYMPLKVGSSLTSKLNKRDAAGRHYWEREGCEGLPFLLALADFHRSAEPEEGEHFGSMVYTQGALPTYLYGIRVHVEEVEGRKVIRQTPVERHAYNGKDAPSGFFRQPLAENVAAVLFTNAATLAKFDRIGVLAGFAPPGSHYIRMGHLFNPDPGAIQGIPFQVEVGSEGYEEFWGDELQVFHNPWAASPVSPDAFPDAVHFFFENGLLTSRETGGRVLSSVTMILTPDGAGESGWLVGR